MKQNKNVLIGVVCAVVVVIVIAFLVNKRYHPTPAQIPADSATTDIPLISLKEAHPKPSVVTPKELVPNTPHDYDKTLAEFKDKRIQFSSDCTATPKSSVYSEGEKIMIDNRGGEMRGVTIGNQNIVLLAYDFAVITLFEKGSFGVNCGTLVNTATVLVQ